MAQPATTARCLDCNYLLTGLVEPRCPECARRFDPADARTFNTERPLTWLDRRLLAPAGRITFLLLALLCCAMLLLALNPGFYYMVWFPVTLLFIAAAALLLGARAAMRTFIPPPSVYRPSNRRRRHIAIALIVATLLLVFFHVPLRIAFIFARPALDRIIARTTSQTASQIKPTRAGIYRVVGNRWYGNDDQIFFDVQSDWFSGGFAYCPRGGTLYYNSGADGHLMGPWYWWIDD